MLEYFISCEKKKLHSKMVQISPNISSFMLATYNLSFLPSWASNSLPSLKSRLYGEKSKARKHLSRKKNRVFQPLWSCLCNNGQASQFNHMKDRFSWLDNPASNNTSHINADSYTSRSVYPRHWAKLPFSIIPFHLSPVQECKLYYFSWELNIQSA